MILGAELAMLACGLYMLFTGKLVGKSGVRHWQVRLLGLLMALVIPAAFLIAFVVAFVMGMAGVPLTGPAGPSSALTTATIIVEVSTVVIFGAAGIVWSKLIERRFAPGPTAAPGSAVPLPPRP